MPAPRTYTPSRRSVARPTLTNKNKPKSGLDLFSQFLLYSALGGIGAMFLLAGAGVIKPKRPRP